MGNTENKLVNMPENEMVKMLYETSEFVAAQKVTQLSAAVIAAQKSNTLVNNVEFWKWMGRNYKPSGIFDTNASMQQYIAQGAGKEQWVIKQLQGKGYEWDWMAAQRNNIKNIFNTYDAGDVANRAASDVTKRNIFTGNTKDYQMKAYTSKANPDLKNTPKDMTVVTNAEKVDVVKANGYKNVEKFQDADKIKKATDKRLEQIKSGKADTTYNFKNVTGAMVQSGLFGCVVGMGIETIVSYQAWKSKQLTDEEYIKEIIKAGGEAGITAGATSGIMVPVSATITMAGASTLITIPVAIIVSGAINKIVAPCFGRGQYREILSKAKYYQSLENVYCDLIEDMQEASEQYYNFIEGIEEQNTIYQEIKSYDTELSKKLDTLYYSI